MNDLERKVLGEFVEENGNPAGLVAEHLGVSTAKVTSICKKLKAEGLLEDTGYAMKRDRYGLWQQIDKPKTEGGMISKPGASTVWRATLKGHAAIGHEPSPFVDWKAQERTMAKRKSNGAKQAESAGSDYAFNQIQSDYFMDWVRDQLIEASKMPPEDVLPLETKADALVVAKNMLQQLEWDTKRALGRQQIDYPEAWFKGFHRATETSRDWLADELLEIKRGMRGGLHEGRAVDPTAWYIDLYEGERVMRTFGPYASKKEATKVTRSRARSGLSWGDAYQGMDMGHALHTPRKVRDFIAVDSRGRKIAGPFKSYADAKHAAGLGGHTQFVPSAREGRRPGR